MEEEGAGSARLPTCRVGRESGSERERERERGGEQRESDHTPR